MSTSDLIRPMLAKPVEMEKLRFPCIAQPKIDGIRAIIRDGQLWSRTLKPIPNQFIQQYFADIAMDTIEGLDGELVVGAPNAKDLFQVTTSGVMSEGGEPDFRYDVFDIWNSPDSARTRMEQAQERAESLERKNPRILWTPTVEVPNVEILTELRSIYMEQGMEGMIIRDPDSLYKSGRSTVNEGCLLKWKEWVDEEGTVIAFEELMHNGNAATIDALGHTKRSSHQANKIPGNMLGALVVENPKYTTPLRVGSGFTMAQRQEIWDNKPTYKGQLVKYKHFPIGQKDLPRHPIFLAFRHPDDARSLE